MLEEYINVEIAIKIGIILVSGVIVTRILRWLISKYIKVTSSKLNVDPTKYTFIKNALSMVIWLGILAAIIYVIPKFRTVAITMLAGAGIFLAILGFAAQQAFANIISGIFIVIFKPFRVSDLIHVGQSNLGYVEDITLRHTVINDFENKRIIIPNSVISSETIINYSIQDVRHCEKVEFGISYDSDVDRAMEIISEECSAHPNCIDIRTKVEKKKGIPLIDLKVVGYGDSSVNLRAWVWAEDFMKGRTLHFDVNKTVKKRFDAEGIEIPFPYRTIVYKNSPKNE